MNYPFGSCISNTQCQKIQKFHRIRYLIKTQQFFNGLFYFNASVEIVKQMRRASLLDLNQAFEPESKIILTPRDILCYRV